MRPPTLVRSKPRQRMNDEEVLGAPSTAPANILAADSETNPFFEPFIRCFLLGVASGAVVESFSVLSTVVDVSAQTVSSSQLWTIVEAAYTPHFVMDNVLGIALMLVFYISESACIGLTSPAGNQAFTLFMARLPKVLIPVELTTVNSMLLRLSKRLAVLNATATATNGARAGSVATGVSPTVVTEPQSSAADVDAPLAKKRADLKPGQWDPAQGGKVVEEVAMQNYLEAMYYCIGVAPREGLREGSVYEGNVMGTRVAYWKDGTGAVSTISSICAHRGAPLVNGWIDTVDDITCVRCPYHAWAFDGTGAVRDIPVQPEGGYPRRPLQQAFDTVVRGDKVWVFWGRPHVPRAERPPIPGLDKDSLDGMISEHVTKLCVVPHHATMDVLLSKRYIAAIARVFLGAPSCSIAPTATSATAWASREVDYILTPDTAGQSHFTPLRPRGSDNPAIPVKATAQLPSSVQVAFDLGRGRRVVVEAHVHPESYTSSRVTFSAHQNVIPWPAARPIVRGMLETLAEGQRGIAEGRQLRAPSEVSPFAPTTNTGEPLVEEFAKLRVEFVNLGYGVPAEVVAGPSPTDL